ncbi:adaptin N terminal region-domain-containing protein [Flammula alnicola]|nr:adaptin N terminal region-domain-containing protein [Flammula alnicola]
MPNATRMRLRARHRQKTSEQHSSKRTAGGIRHEMRQNHGNTSTPVPTSATPSVGILSAGKFSFASSVSYVASVSSPAAVAMMKTAAASTATTRISTSYPQHPALLSTWIASKAEGCHQGHNRVDDSRESGLFLDVLKNMQTDDLEQKELYLYLMNHAKTQPELVILAINTFAKGTDDPNPLVRALAIRTMGCLRAEKIIDYLSDPLQKCLRDENPYVPKMAALCVAKLYDLKLELVIDNGFLE